MATLFARSVLICPEISLHERGLEDNKCRKNLGRIYASFFIPRICLVYAIDYLSFKFLGGRIVSINLKRLLKERKCLFIAA